MPLIITSINYLVHYFSQCIHNIIVKGINCLTLSYNYVFDVIVNSGKILVYMLKSFQIGFITGARILLVCGAIPHYRHRFSDNNLNQYSYSSPTIRQLVIWETGPEIGNTMFLVTL